MVNSQRRSKARDQLRYATLGVQLLISPLRYFANNNASSLIRYALMQVIKESSTLRIGQKGSKPRPKVIYRWGKQKGQVDAFLRKQRQFNKIVK
jgi:hypothetical protein